MVCHTEHLHHELTSEPAAARRALAPLSFSLPLAAPMCPATPAAASAGLAAGDGAVAAAAGLASVDAAAAVRCATLGVVLV